MGKFQSQYTGSEMDAKLTLSQENKGTLTSMQAALEALQNQVQEITEALQSSGILTSMTLIGVATITVNATFTNNVAQKFTATLTGAAEGDVVIPFSGAFAGWGPITHISGINPLQLQACWVSAANTVASRWYSGELSGDQTFTFDFKVLVLRITQG